jgi:hypothetical protein
MQGFIYYFRLISEYGDRKGGIILEDVEGHQTESSATRIAKTMLREVATIQKTDTLILALKTKNRGFAHQTFFMDHMKMELDRIALSN